MRTTRNFDASSVITLGESPPSPIPQSSQNVFAPNSSKSRLPQLPQRSKNKNLLSFSQIQNPPPNLPSRIFSVPPAQQIPRVIMPRQPTVSTNCHPIPQYRAQLSFPPNPSQQNPGSHGSTTNDMIPSTEQFNRAAKIQRVEVRKAVDEYIDKNGANLSYLNYYPFVITTVNKLIGWKKRNCIQCGHHLGFDAENHVIAHYEAYEHPSFTGIRNAMRSICPFKRCMIQRYPFINKECFISDLNLEVTARILERIIRKTN